MTGSLHSSSLTFKAVPRHTCIRQNKSLRFYMRCNCNLCGGLVPEDLYNSKLIIGISVEWSLRLIILN